MTGRHVFLAAALLLPSGVFAAQPLSPSDRDAVEQQQRDVLRQNQQQREELQRTLTLPPATPQATVSDAGPCFTISRIELDGAEKLTGNARDALVSPYRNQCLNLARINQLAQRVSDWYLSRGYVTSRAFLTEQNLTSGTLNLKVVEGRLEDIKLENAPDRTLAMAFPGLKGKVLNLRDIEQGMEQINRVRNEPVQIEIQPGSQPGYSVVNLTASPEFPLQFGAGFDNSGQKSTGVGQINASLSANNVLGIADKWYVSGARSSAFSNSKDAQSVQAGVSVPYGYFTVDYNYSWSEYVSTFDNNGFPWRSTGDTETHRLNGAWVAYRDSDIKTALTLGVNHRISRNYLNDAYLGSSSRTLTGVMAGINHSQKLWGGFATLNPAYSRGVPWLGAEDDKGKHPDAPRAEYTKWTLSGSYYRPLRNDLNYITSIYGQWTDDRLYGSERLTLGGESSVRGFKEQYLSGDVGGYWRNELNQTVFELPWLGQVGALAAVDGGYLRHKTDDDFSHGTLWGGAIGLYSNGRYAASQLTVGWPLRYPGGLAPDRVSVYYRIGFVL